MIFRLPLVVLVHAVWLICLPAAHAQGRVALVIGNGAYQISPLKNPVNDARAMTAKLGELGFGVIYRENLRTKEIGATLTEFRSRIRAGDHAVVVYAGHGLQVKGTNYLPAVDAEINSEYDVPQQSLNLSHLLEALEESKAGVKIVFLDACRDNPYARTYRSAERGLSRIGSAPSGTLIAFATRPGSVAADGTGQNGLYTEQLLSYIGAEGVPIEQMLKKVAVEVEKASGGKQEPWSEGNIKGDFFFRLGSGQGTQVASLKPEPVRPAPAPVQAPASRSEDPETQFWNEVKASGAKEYYEAYVKQYPKGKYVALAKVELKKLEDQEKARKAREDAEAQLAEQGAWDNAKAVNSATSYAAYLGAYPNGRFAALAQIARQKAQRGEEERARLEAERTRLEAARRQQEAERQAQQFSISASDGLALARAKNCMACHSTDRKIVGPSFMDVARRYRGQPDAERLLMEKVRKGGLGVWGTLPMPPNLAVSESDILRLVRWILAGQF